ncbi:hypothetical protein C8R43DRAFT_202336 [Mycena crocata]|nr:hypothetical protein C8R43DRAFT_202336 [Mycena crocata]
MDAPTHPDPQHVHKNGVLETPEPVPGPDIAAAAVVQPLDDPTTPVSNAVASEPKIDIDLPEQESDARHEPLPHLPVPPEPGALSARLQRASDASYVYSAIHAPNGVNGTNGDVAMEDMDLQSPATTPGAGPPASSNGASTSHTSPADPPTGDQEDDQPPPAKRPRILSDADKASFTHVSLVFLCAP